MTSARSTLEPQTEPNRSWQRHFGDRRLWLVGTMVLLAALSRLVPHINNFSPIGAMALFGGSAFTNKRLGIAFPLLALFLSDLVIGLHDGMIFVYGSIFLISCLGIWIGERRTPGRIAMAGAAGALLFFLVTNFGYWLVYMDHTGAALVQCYIQAIPFFRATVAGDLVFNAALFGGFALVETYVPRLMAAPAPAEFTF